MQLNSFVKDSFNCLLNEESPFDEILKELKSGRVEVKKKHEKYKKKTGFLVIYRDNQNEEADYWRVVVPDDVEQRILIIR